MRNCLNNLRRKCAMKHTWLWTTLLHRNAININLNWQWGATFLADFWDGFCVFVWRCNFIDTCHNYDFLYRFGTFIIKPSKFWFEDERTTKFDLRNIIWNLLKIILGFFYRILDLPNTILCLLNWRIYNLRQGLANNAIFRTSISIDQYQTRVY